MTEIKRTVFFEPGRNGEKRVRYPTIFLLLPF